MIEPLLQETVGSIITARIDCLIRQSPNTTSEVISEMRKDNEAVIVEDLNYYYKVKIYNEDGEEKEGFVAKKNVEIIDSTDSK